ncbi:hypothetical protein PIB30_078130 [Stylosanthes scabra]|uniref:TIR domain-containing protein n=1 Tax=Stylosanthes scabra TaxID=79078 RepID=A0ABU6UPI1_9FABA|nr:hypothetical protein [Stylosanthes scabra]
MAASSSSDLDSTPLSYFKYDVFLSFRGYTRFGLTDTLYHALVNKRIDTFRDSEELRIGEELEGSLLEAIQRSRMSILILCDEYPTSRWCLDELVKIMECSDNGRKRPVLPIYFNVAKSDVQYQNNEYGKAMAAHEEKGRYNHKLEAWKSALCEVGKIYGQRCDQKTPWGMAIDNIVEEVTKRLPPLPLHIDHPLGLDSELVEAKSLLEIDSHGTCFMLGIHGDGDDISKFVAELYNMIRPHFVTASFLSNIREKTSESGGSLEDLQETLLSEMGEEVKSKIGSTFKGSSEIKRRLGLKRVLLVLDDVDSIQSLKSLAGGIDWFGPGSRIIITTRYEDVLDDYISNNGVEVKKYCITEGSSSTVKKENVVGLEKDFEIVINQLKEDDSPENVVSIVGMGGLGKTTLARKVYNSDEVKKLFPCRAWATVSKEYSAKEVFKSLLKCLKPSQYEDSSSEEELKQKVSKCLKGKKYLVVLDDVWDAKAWRSIKTCLPENNNGGMILVTTRNDQVAYVSESKEPHHNLPFMDKEKSWELFHKEVFCRKSCPPELEPIGRSIAESCKGLPLAIKTTAGLVAKRERSEDAWEEIMDLLPYWSIAEEDSSEVLEILKFSYDDLPNKMKPCFLYLGVFPEDDEIFVRDLIRLWMAEGFIEPIQTGRSKAPPQPEDIGEQYLKELVDRNLVQVAKRRSDGKGVKTCQIHDLFRELCISESNKPDNNNNNAHKLSFPSNLGSYACLVTCNQSCTCSLFLDNDVKSEWLHHIPKDCRVKVLSFADGPTPNDLSGLTDEFFKVLIKSLRFLKTGESFELSKFQNLETCHTEFGEKELSIGGLKQLRHLRSEFGVNFSVDDEGVKVKMQNLQTLSLAYADSQLGSLLNNGCFPNLRKLGLIVHEDHGSAEENLRSLHCLSNLRKLVLMCERFWIPFDRIAFPSNLIQISLSHFKDLNSMHMNTFGQIPRLQILKLKYGSCEEETLNCGTAGSFPRLQVFIMERLGIKCLTSEEGAMPRLRRAVFYNCPELREVTKQMCSLGSNLEFVEHRDVEVDDLVIQFSELLNDL